MTRCLIFFIELLAVSALAKTPEQKSFSSNSHSYQYDALNRRTKATLEDGSFWQYGYDDRDELTSANRNWPTSPAPVSGQQFSYAYDTIGNRQSAGFGGDTSGANLRTITYTNNSLNQYIGITTPGYENIIGAALATNSVSVNGGTADRHGEYFHREISVANTNQPIWQNAHLTYDSALAIDNLCSPVS